MPIGLRAGIVLAASLLVCDVARAQLQLRYADQSLTVHATDVALTDVLAELARQAGADVRGGLHAPRTVSAEFVDVPLPEAMHRLMGDESFVLVYAADRLRRIRLLGDPDADGVVVAAARSEVGDEPAPIDDGGATAAFQPVRVHGRLAKAVGASEATFQQLFQVAAQNADRRVRAVAIKAWLAFLDRQPLVRRSVAMSLGVLDDASAAAWMQTNLGENSREILRRVAMQDDIPELRDKAGDILRVMQEQRGVRQPGNVAG